MIVKYLGVIIIFFSAISVSLANLIGDKHGINISKMDVNALLKGAPVKAQIGLLDNKAQLQVKLVQQYLTKAIANEVKKEGLSAEQQQELNKMVDLFYFRAKVKQLSTENLPEFEPLAKMEYDSAKEKYSSEEKVAVEHILVSTKKREEDKALKLIQEIKDRIDKGADFNLQARQYSEDPMVEKNQGKLGLFGKGQMVKPFEDVAYSLEMGELSEPVKTDFGYHLIRKYKHVKPGVQPYPEVKEQIIEQLKKEFVQTRLDNYFDEIKVNNKMQVNDEKLNAYIKAKKLELNSNLEKK